MRLRSLAVALACVVLVASGVYVFLYLYRWEWNRTLVAGIFFLATQITLATALIMGRLRRLEEELARLETAPSPTGLAAMVDDAFAPRDPFAPGGSFAWLRTDGAGVFIPVLLGAGMLLSALAWAVERLALASARPVVRDRVMAGLAEGTPPAAPPAPRRSPARSALALLAAVAVVGLGVDRLSDLTQNRPDPVLAGSTATVVLEVVTRDGTGLADAGERLWVVCSDTVTVDRASLAHHGARTEIRVEPAPGPHGERRLRGCLEDAVLDEVQARVLAIR